MRFSRMCVTLAMLAAPTVLFAQDQLPKKLEGSWDGVATGRGAGAHVGGPMSVTIEKQNPDGSVEGKLTFSGRFCAANDTPMTGRLEGEVLTLQVSLQSMMPNAGCSQSTKFVLHRGTDGAFVGEIPGSSQQIKVKLAPK